MKSYADQISESLERDIHEGRDISAYLVKADYIPLNESTTTATAFPHCSGSAYYTDLDRLFYSGIVNNTMRNNAGDLAVRLSKLVKESEERFVRIYHNDSKQPYWNCLPMPSDLRDQSYLPLYRNNTCAKEWIELGNRTEINSLDPACISGESALGRLIKETPMCYTGWNTCH